LRSLREPPSLRERVAGGIVGLVVGDALGLPAQFRGRDELRRNPIKGMVRSEYFGTPPGTWSDDSSLALATVDAIIREGLDLNAIAEAFVDWLERGEYTPFGEAFDIGSTVSSAILRLISGEPPTSSGLWRASNGSLMRILPIPLYTHCLPPEDVVEWAFKASAITHSHPLALLSCGYYSLLIKAVMEGRDKREALETASKQLVSIIKSRHPNLIKHLEPGGELGRVITLEILNAEEGEVQSTGYVVHTLEASIWAFHRTNTFREALLLAVNLGDDADTVGAVCGGLAGTYYGIKAIPSEWVNSLRRREYVLSLAEGFAEAVTNHCGVRW